MEFTLVFLQSFGLGLFFGAPIIVLLLALIALLGMFVGRREGWSRSDALYYAFITATTVGYGDFRPGQPLAKAVAIAIAMTGLLLTGIVVAIGVRSAELAFEVIHSL